MKQAGKDFPPKTNNISKPKLWRWMGKRRFFWVKGQWLFLVPLKGGIGGIVHPPIGRKNATYIPLIYCLLGDYMLPIPPFRGTRNNHSIHRKLTAFELQVMEMDGSDEFFGQRGDFFWVFGLGSMGSTEGSWLNG